MTPRLATSILVGALIRKAETDGGFGAVLAKGDERAGSIILILTQRGADPQVFERILQPDGAYRWGESAVAESKGVPDFIARRSRLDPDLWAVELDVPSRERFAAEMNLSD